MIDRTTSATHTTADLAWAFLVMGIVLFLCVLLWSFLGESVYMMLDMAVDQSSSQRVHTSAERITLFWKYFPLVIASAIMFFGYRRAVTESRGM